MTKSVKLLSLISVLIIMVSSLAVPFTAMAAAKVSPSTVYTAVKKAYSKNFPLDSNSKVLSSSSVGVSKKDYSSYYGRYKGTKTKYLIFIAKANDSSSAKKIKSQLNNYVKTESKSMENYLTSQGKKLYKNAKVGSKGNYVYLVMLDTQSNKKAVDAINKSVK